MIRRTFLSGIAALVCAPSIVSAENVMALPRRPFVWGDGIHDDTAAIQWMLDNYRSVTLDGKHYRIDGGLHIPMTLQELTASGAIFDGSRGTTTNPLLFVNAQASPLIVLARTTWLRGQHSFGCFIYPAAD